MVYEIRFIDTATVDTHLRRQYHHLIFYSLMVITQTAVIKALYTRASPDLSDREEFNNPNFRNNPHGKTLRSALSK